MKLVKRIKSVSFFIDSDEIRATKIAIETLPAKIIWIKEDFDDASEVESLYPTVKEKVRAIIWLKKEKSVLFNSFYKDLEFLIEADTIDEAVSIAATIAKLDDSVLFSAKLSANNTESDYSSAINKLN